MAGYLGCEAGQCWKPICVEGKLSFRVVFHHVIPALVTLEGTELDIRKYPHQRVAVVPFVVLIPLVLGITIT